MRKTTLLLLGLGLVAAAAPLARAHYPMLMFIGEEGQRLGPVFAEGELVTCDYTIGHPFADDRFAILEPPSRVDLFSPLGGEPKSLLIAHVASTTLQFAGQDVEASRIRFRVPRKEAGDFILALETKYFEKPSRNLRDYTKIYLHVPGDVTPGHQLGWSQSTGAPLEILPLTRPYWIPVGGVFRGQVVQRLESKGRKESAPLRGGVVEAETWGAEGVTSVVPELAAYRRAELTDPNGCFGVTLDRAGWWLVSVALDGGPGEQGGLEDRVTQRAVAWIFVGPPPRQVTYDHFPGSRPRDPSQPAPVPVHPPAQGAQPPK